MAVLLKNWVLWNSFPAPLAGKTSPCCGLWASALTMRVEASHADLWIWFGTARHLAVWLISRRVSRPTFCYFGYI